ncbi:COG4705 family protein [Demequina capsici]|uniref:Membrane-anchored protein n=1 Tax=Demequina capsici TaxID=3075620 RepID=A0AA96F8Y6_9MICO|nr:hypothetical protein [Demequina sp. OYTSA14]WNM23900.1 hypothetical protein RN606_11105 [Demequina sp. OYTSA14]
MTTRSTTDPTARRSLEPFLNKVPTITATFWLIKVLSTTVGETFADYLTVQVGLGWAVTDGAMLVVLAAVMFAQLRTRRYVPAIYWATVVLVSIVGTQITDLFTDIFGVSLYVSTAVFMVLLAIVFTVWWREERTLAITSIDTPRRERFYWGAILVTFALGTAAGDLATEALSLGFRNGALIFSGLILAVWAAKKLGLSTVVAFWIAYVLTRPLGASLGDLLSQDKSYGGIGLGAQTTSVLFLLVIVALVAREQLVVRRHGVRTKGQAPAVHPARDAAWAGSGLVAVTAAALFLAPGATAAPTATTSDARTPIEADTTSPIGDLTGIATIVDDIGTLVDSGDLAGAKTRAKDLEVAWDSSEAAMKPQSPADWHSIDGAIDETLTAVRAGTPTQDACSTAVAALQSSIATVEGEA